MRTVTLPDQKEIEVRGLTRKEIKAKFKKHGYGRSRWALPKLKPGDDPDEIVSQAIDAALKHVLSEADFKRLEEYAPRFTAEAWMGLIKETYGEALEVKNS